jgi:hypothetical protein
MDVCAEPRKLDLRERKGERGQDSYRHCSDDCAGFDVFDWFRLGDRMHPNPKYLCLRWLFYVIANGSPAELQ